MSNPYQENPYSQPEQENPYPASNPYPTYQQQQPPQQQGTPESYGTPPPAYGTPAQYAPSGTPYGYQPYTPALPEHPQGTVILVLAIIGIFAAVTAPIAWILGSKARKEIAASGLLYSNESQIITGRILGMTFTIIYAAGFILTILATIALVVFADATGY